MTSKLVIYVTATHLIYVSYLGHLRPPDVYKMNDSSTGDGGYRQVTIRKLKGEADTNM